MALFKTKNFNPPPSLGTRGENAALAYLQKEGYDILETNFCNPSGRRLGEIDIIAKDKQELVFIEVKTRRSSSFNTFLPEENINANKLYKLNKIASFYLKKHNPQGSEFRFDAISILASPENNSAKLRHIKNIFL